MNNKYLKNSIISLTLIVSIVLTPLAFLPKKAEAQGIAATLGGLAGTITQLPLCQDKIVSAYGNIFGKKTKPLVDKTQSTSTSNTTPPMDTENSILGLDEQGNPLDSAAKDIVKTDEVIKVEIQKQINDNLEKIAKDTKTTTDNVTKTTNNDTCLKSIGRVVIKTLLQKITVSTVEWINNGYDGSPMFIQDPGTFFKDIAKNELLQFNSEISNPQLFPFGKVWMQNQARAFNKKFADNARYSLNELIQKTTPEYTAQTFTKNFSQGGWDAWDYMTQVPANNPLGFNIKASNELQKRLEGTNQSNAQNMHESLLQAGGYLGSERCVAPSTKITREEHNKALNNVPGARKCLKWEYVTPGKMVADAAFGITNSPKDSLLKAEDLNDAVAAILDATLSQFSTNMMSESGFVGMTQTDSQFWSQAGEGKFMINTDNTEDYSGSTDYSGSESLFLQQNPNFNIRTDLTQALIDEQRIFVDKLKEQNKELNSTTDDKAYKLDDTTGTSNAYGLIPTIYQEDYCIPGPHPGWESDTQKNIDAFNSVVPVEITSIITDPQIYQNNDFLLKAKFYKLPGFTAELNSGTGQFIKQFSSFVLAAIKTITVSVTPFGIGVTFSAAPIIDFIDRALASFYNKAMYTAVFKVATGIKANNQGIDGKSVTAERTVAGKIMGYVLSFGGRVTTPVFSKLPSKSALAAALNNIFDKYIKASDDEYNKTAMIYFQLNDNESNFAKVSGYNQLITNNKSKIDSMTTVVNKLTQIKDDVDQLNSDLATGGLDQTQYEEKLKSSINVFGRLSTELVTGDDIAKVDSRVKQIIDEKNYIYNNLIKGGGGCEEAIKLTDKKITEQKRPTYPYPILYDYNKNLPKENGYYIKMGKNNGIGDGLALVKLEDMFASEEINTTVTSKIFEDFFSIY